MNITDCLTRLAVNELSNTAFSTGTEITPAKVPMVVICMNEALMLLYSKFLISEKAVFVELNEYRTKYVLTRDHLIQSCKSCEDDDLDDKYLWDSEEYPFTGDIIKILYVSSDKGFIYPLNDPGDYLSLYTPAYNILQVPHPQRGETLAVSYQAKHPTLNFAKLDTALELPRSLHSAFFTYVAYLVFNSMQSESAMATSQKFLAHFNTQLQEIILNDTLNTSYSQSNTRFIANGWC